MRNEPLSHLNATYVQGSGSTIHEVRTANKPLFTLKYTVACRRAVFGAQSAVLLFESVSG